MADAAAIGNNPSGVPRAASASARRSDWRFKWLLVAPAALLILAISIYPLLFSLWVSFVNYDFQIPGHAFVGLKNFEQVIFDPVARYSLWVTVVAFRRERRRRIPARPRASRWPWPTRFRGRGLIISILIVPLFISPVIVGQAWALLLQRPVRPDQLLSRPAPRRTTSTISWLTQWPWQLHGAHPRRRLAVDAVHVRHPARRADGDPAACL